MKFLSHLFDFRRNLWIYINLSEFGNFGQANDSLAEMKFRLTSIDKKVEVSSVSKARYLSVVYGPMDMMYAQVKFPRKMEESVRNEIRCNGAIHVLEQDVFSSDMF